MPIHKNSMAEKIRKYKRENPIATRGQIAEATGTNLQQVSRVLSYARLKAGVTKKRKTAVLTKKANTTAGVRLDGGYYSLDKLKDIVRALEVLSKISGVAKAKDD